MQEDDLREYPISHALALMEIRDELHTLTKKVRALPGSVDSVEEQAVRNQLAQLLTALEQKGIYTPLTD